jgi:hypothetical protein
VGEGEGIMKKERSKYILIITIRFFLLACAMILAALVDWKLLWAIFLYEIYRKVDNTTEGFITREEFSERVVAISIFAVAEFIEKWKKEKSQ